VLSPGTQLSQVIEPAVEYLPAAQTLQKVLTVELANDPASHGVQALDAALLLYDPKEQGKHDTAPLVAPVA
jgi:hypothetical protein